MSNKNSRFKEDICYILHSFSWKETSLIVKVFSRNFGCLSMVAKGAKRPYSQLRPVLSKFSPLVLTWSGNTEMKNLVKAEISQIISMPSEFLMPSWYLNELILSFLPKEDPHANLFDAYDNALFGLSKCNINNVIVSSILRRFEWFLLKEIGYGIDGQEPDFENKQQEPIIRQILSKRIDNNLYGKILYTKKILKDLRYFIY
ncbi:DNA repair protein RecO [Candidatus Kinetoplastibacterium desouzaii TCC079E]|uniref:DNA repair protein RecO n=1 Tax=Candidatus Kinetoplastidibacterium desouzai TCC079E TaxID=1208919 RepID=M1L2M3_9PROT|nr:DNA repair protein RecO [Candidatus Kinetoplastibacterium desouzaii]AGF47003.1 DNA repair protein RecO [Candidatus Kinetoplastibacterium desouzaii TCC079E]